MGNLIRCQNGHLFSARRYGTVCPYCNIETATKEKKETGQTDIDIEEKLFLEETQPVCGWIVCISGARQGKDYKIKSGKNFVGRADDMDIQILGDNKISRRNHAVIVFDPKKKETVLLPGDSNGIVYLNDAAVYTPMVLNPYDVIELGDSTFLFLPFCGVIRLAMDKTNWLGVNFVGMDKLAALGIMDCINLLHSDSGDCEFLGKTKPCHNWKSNDNWESGCSRR